MVFNFEVLRISYVCLCVCIHFWCSSLVSFFYLFILFYLCLFCLPICVLKREKEGGELDGLGGGKDQGEDETGNHY